VETAGYTVEIGTAQETSCHRRIKPSVRVVEETRGSQKHPVYDQTGLSDLTDQRPQFSGFSRCSLPGVLRVSIALWGYFLWRAARGTPIAGGGWIGPATTYFFGQSTPRPRRHWPQSFISFSQGFGKEFQVQHNGLQRRGGRAGRRRDQCDTKSGSTLPRIGFGVIAKRRSTRILGRKPIATSPSARRAHILYQLGGTSADPW